MKDKIKTKLNVTKLIKQLSRDTFDMPRPKRIETKKDGKYKKTTRDYLVDEDD